MKKYKVYQIQRNILENHKYEVRINVIAEYEIKEHQSNNDTLLEKIWDICNVSCWSATWHRGEPVVKGGLELTPTIFFIGFCNDDIVVETPEGLFKAEMAGWKKVESVEEGIYRIIYTYSFNWNDITNKDEFDKQKLDDVIKKIQEED